VPSLASRSSAVAAEPAAGAVLLRGEATELLGRLLRARVFGVGLILQGCRVGGGGLVGFLGCGVLAGEALGLGLLGGDVGLQIGDEAFDARDLGGFGRLVVLGTLDVVPRRIVGGERGGAEARAECAQTEDAEATEAQRRAARERTAQASQLALGGRAAAVLRRAGLVHHKRPQFRVRLRVGGIRHTDNISHTNNIHPRRPAFGGHPLPCHLRPRRRVARGHHALDFRFSWLSRMLERR